MSFLKSLEREYVMGDTQLFNEYDVSHFISNAKSAITNKVEAVNMNMKFDYYTSMLGKAIQSFSTIKLDKESIRDFLMKFESLSKLDNSEIMVRDITFSDIATFKPQYLAQFTSMVQIAIDRAMTGNITNEEIIRYISGEIPEKIQRQIVKTTLPYGVTSKDLIKIDSTKYEKADTAFVKGKLIPFVTKYDQTKNEALAEANSVMNAIKEAEETVKAMIISIEKIKASGNVNQQNIQLLNQISYNAIRGMIEVISYVSYMMVRKLNNISNNIIASNQLYIDITNLYNDMTTESAFDTNMFPTDIKSLTEGLMNGRVDAFVSLAEKIYEFNTGLPDPENVENNPSNETINHEVDQHDYDNTVYENIIKAFIEISVGLDVLSVEGDEYLLIYDDIIQKSGFGVILEERFQNEIEDIKHVQDEAVNLVRLLSELKTFDGNMNAVASVIMETYKKLKYLQKRYENNTNGEYRDFETVNELKVFLFSLEEQYTSFVEKVAQSFYDRLKNIGMAITEIKEHNEQMERIENQSIHHGLDFSESFVDYNDFVFNDIIESYDDDCKNHFDNLQRSYFAEKELALRGVDVIFEADDANTNTDSQTTQQPVQNSTKVIVQDNSPESKQSGKTSSIISRVGAFIRKTVDRFLEFIGKSSTKNAKWLAENKNELMNRSYNNVTVNILPYNNIPSNQILGDITKLQNNIKTITPQTLQGITNKDSLYAKLFPFVSGGIKEANGSLSDQFMKYYKVGTSNLQVVPISNGELKTEITSVMIPFCEEYLSTFKDTLDKDLSSVGKVLDETVAKFNTTTTTESVSIFTEAETQNTNTQGNMKEKTAWMSEAVKYFSGSVLNAVRDRNADYLKVLSSLVPKTPTNPAKPAEPAEQPEQKPEETQNA